MVLDVSQCNTSAANCLHSWSQWAVIIVFEYLHQEQVTGDTYSCKYLLSNEN